MLRKQLKYNQIKCSIKTIKSRKRGRKLMFKNVFYILGLVSELSILFFCFYMNPLH